MRFAAAPLALSLALLAVPALAQTGNNATSSMNNGSVTGHNGQTSQPYNSATSTQATTSGTEQNGGQYAANQGISNDTQQKLRQSLEQNGFRNVQVTAEAFVIHAQAPDGSHVVMEVTPDEVQGVVESTGSSSGNNATNQSQNGTWNSHSGAGTSGGTNR